MSRLDVPNDQQWHFFAMTYSGGTTMSIYLDGQLKDRDLFAASNGIVTPSALVFGHDVDFLNAPERGLNGQLDELAFLDRALSDAEVLQLWTASRTPIPGTTATAPYRQTSQSLGGLRSYWRFSETSGTTAVDSVGANHGTYVNVAGFPVNLAQAGPGADQGFVGMPAGNTAVRFVHPDGTNYMEVENGAVVGNPETGLSFEDGVSELTMSFWFKNAFNGPGYVAGFERGGETARYIFTTYSPDDTRLRFYVRAGNEEEILSSYVTIDEPGDYQWHHVVQVWDGSERRLTAYVDGLEVYNGTNNLMSESLAVPEGFFVGRDQLALPDPLRDLGGFVDELALYDRALTAEEVFLLYDSAFFAGTTSKIPGDATGNDVVDEDDAKALAANWGVTSGAQWADGDFNDDGKVDARDAAILAANWGATSGGESAATAVPEPGVFAALAGVLAAFVVGNRRGTRKPRCEL